MLLQVPKWTLLICLVTCAAYVTASSNVTTDVTAYEDDPDADHLDDGVDTPSGRILGLDTKFFGQRAKSYLGVPYARPPIGGLRFRRPEAPLPREGVFAADTMPPACVQYSEYDFPWYDNMGGKSEDCLYLNIWSPRFAPSLLKLPVILWIHGGGYTLGSNRIRAQSGLGLAMLGTSIVVAPNYRLGAMGFLSAPSSDGNDEEAPGNVGLHDLLLALQWVRENIAPFGGDVDRITLMGEGAGAQIVGLFLLSPLTQGLFSRAIMQSGSPLALPQDPNARNGALGQRLADALGCTPGNKTLKDDPQDTIKCLREVRASRMARVLSSFDPTSEHLFTPQFGDALLPRDPTLDLKEGRFSPVPLLIGTNKDEGAHLLTASNPDTFGAFGQKGGVDDPRLTAQRGAALVRDAFQNSDRVPDPEEVVRQYLGEDEPDDADPEVVRRQVYTAMGDYEITCPAVYFAEMYAASPGVTTNASSSSAAAVQFYLFGQRPTHSKFAPWMGSTHWSEVPFVMGRYLDKYDYDSFIKDYNAELGLTDAMTRIWGKFAKEGSGFEGWKSYSRNHHQYMLLKYNVKKKMRGPGPHLDNCNFFRPYFFPTS